MVEASIIRFFFFVKVFLVKCRCVAKLSVNTVYMHIFAFVWHFWIFTLLYISQGYEVALGYFSIRHETEVKNMFVFLDGRRMKVLNIVLQIWQYLYANIIAMQ